MKKSRAVVLTALVAGATMVMAACSTATPSSSNSGAATTSAATTSAAATSSAGESAPASESGSAGESSSASESASSAPSSASDGTGEIAETYTRPKVESSPNITMAVEENTHDYNNNTSTANNFSNSGMSTQTQPSVFYVDNAFKLYVDKDLMDSVTVKSLDPQVIEYKISPKAVWSDGAPVDCSDFYLIWLQAASKATIKAEDGSDAPAFDPAGTAGYDQMQAPVCSDNDKTVTVTFDTPFADWKGSFAAMVPAHVIEADSGVADVTKIKATDTTGDVLKFAASYVKNFAGFNPKFDLSAGPFLLQSLSDEQTVLVRNDKYWGNPAGPESITLVTNTDGQSQVQQLQNGEVQVIQPQPDAALADQLRNSPNVVFNAYAGATYEHIDFNMSLPLFQGKEGDALREASFYCIDRTAMIDKLIKGVNPETKPLGNFMFLPQEAAYQDHYADYITANVDKAKSIMEAAGWKLGSDGVYAIGDKKAEFRLGHKVIDTREKVAQLVNASCAKAGIKVDDDQDEDFNAKRLPASDFDTALFAWVGTPFKSGSYGIYTTGGGGNYNKYSNKEVDKLFKQSNSELDEAKRNDLLNQIDQLIAKDHASMPTYQFSDMVAQSSSITPTLTYVGPSGGALWNAQEWVYKQ